MTSPRNMTRRKGSSSKNSNEVFVLSSSHSSVFARLSSGLPARVVNGSSITKSIRSSIGSSSSDEKSRARAKKREEEAAARASELCANLEKRQYRDTTLKKINASDTTSKKRREASKTDKKIRNNRVERNIKLAVAANTIKEKTQWEQNRESRESRKALSMKDSQEESTRLATTAPADSKTKGRAKSLRKMPKLMSKKQKESSKRSSLLENAAKSVNKSTPSEVNTNRHKSEEVGATPSATTTSSSPSRLDRISIARNRKREMEKRLAEAMKASNPSSGVVDSFTSSITSATVSIASISSRGTSAGDSTLHHRIPQDDLLGLGVSAPPSPPAYCPIVATSADLDWMGQDVETFGYDSMNTPSDLRRMKIHEKRMKSIRKREEPSRSFLKPLQAVY